jgi:epoxyqueuosine reductase QueG
MHRNLRAQATRDLKQFARGEGADLVGVASADRFAGAPSGHRPEDILEGARSVVSCALELPVGALLGPATAYHQIMISVHQELDRLARRIALHLEVQGAVAVPVPADEPYREWDEQQSRGVGDLSHKHAAQAAGLGKLGKSSLLITREYGNRIQLVSIVTQADLEPDPLLDWEPCPGSCTLCVRACPAGAIGTDGAVDQALCRKVMMERLPRGWIIESCSKCRLACPATAAAILRFSGARRLRP